MTPNSLRWALAVLIEYIAVWVLVTFILYALRDLWAWPIRRWLKESYRENVTLLVALLIAIVLSLTWLQQPMKVIYDPDAPPF